MLTGAKGAKMKPYLRMENLKNHPSIWHITKEPIYGSTTVTLPSKLQLIIYCTFLVQESLVEPGFMSLTESESEKSERFHFS